VITERIRYISSNAVVTISIIEKINWNEEWEKSVQPIEIGERFVVKPSWAEYKGDKDRIILHIDPKMSFGTGYHETTRLTLRLLEKYMEKDYEVVDVGTGTGILAIAAVKLGCKKATGTDIDEWSIENASENVARNQVESAISIEDKSLNDFAAESIDLITANLTLNTNTEFLKEFHRILKDGGKLLLSGLLHSDKNAMERNLISNSFEVLSALTENEWIAIAAAKK
jgi:Ribosomal protein L11 methylase